jgi:hypothetical protein
MGLTETHFSKVPAKTTLLLALSDEVLGMILEDLNFTELVRWCAASRSTRKLFEQLGEKSTSVHVESMENILSALLFRVTPNMVDLGQVLFFSFLKVHSLSCTNIRTHIHEQTFDLRRELDDER